MNHTLSFSLFEQDGYQISDMSLITVPEEAPPLLPCPGSPSNSICQRPGSPGSGAGSADDDVSVEDLKERLRQATQEKEELEESCVTKAQAAEKIAKVLLRKVHRLRVALVESELKRRPEVLPRPMHTINPPPRNPTPRRRPLVPAPACVDRSHQSLVAALEQSLKHTTQAIRNEENRAREVAKLKEQLSSANKILNDERQLSRMLTLQAEGIQKVLKVQHGEIKERKNEIEGLCSLVKALQLENARLMAYEEGKNENEVEGLWIEEMHGKIGELEKQVKELEDKNKGLKKQVDEEKHEGKKLARQAAHRVKAEWYTLCIDWYDELNQLERDNTDFETRFMSFIQKQKAARELEIRQELQAQLLPQAEIQKIAGELGPSVLAEWDRTNIEFQGLPLYPSLDVYYRLDESEKKNCVLEHRNRDLEVELANVRQVAAELAGFEPLERFHRHHSPLLKRQDSESQTKVSDEDVPELVPGTTLTTTNASSPTPTSASTSASVCAAVNSWHLDVPDADEIPELRLPVCSK